MAPGRHIHPSAIIGDQVSLGDDVVVGPGAVLLGPLEVGSRVWIGPNVVIGTPPEMSSLRQNRAWDSDVDHLGVKIGNDVVIRELSTIHQGSHRTTTISDGTWLLNSVYVAHDSLVGQQVTLSAGVRLGGHSIVGSHSNIGMNASVHQHRVVGFGSMIGMGTPTTHDLPPFSKAYGSPIRFHGLNTYVINKLGLPTTVADQIMAAYAAGDFSLESIGEDGGLADELSWWRAQTPARLIRIGSAS